MINSQPGRHRTQAGMKLICDEATGIVSASENHSESMINMTSLTMDQQQRGLPNSLLQ